MHTTKQTVEPLLSFITKVTAARVAAQQAGGTAKLLREQVGGRCSGWGGALGMLWLEIALLQHNLLIALPTYCP
jgi:hypothetical protein